MNARNVGNFGHPGFVTSAAVLRPATSTPLSRSPDYNYASRLRDPPFPQPHNGYALIDNLWTITAAPRQSPPPKAETPAKTAKLAVAAKTAPKRRSDCGMRRRCGWDGFATDRCKSIFTGCAFFHLQAGNGFCKSHRTGRTGAGVAQG